MVSLKQILESVLFSSNKPLPPKALLSLFKSAIENAKEENTAPKEFAKVKETQIKEALKALQEEYSGAERGVILMENAGGWQIVTNPECGPWVKQLFPELKPARLSAPALETLAIIAYRQPITRADIEAVRGVAVDGVMQTLLDRGLVKIAGRAEVPGRPLLYETTQFFMEHFNLRDLDDLPDAHELRTIALPKAEQPAVEETPAEGPATEAAAHEPHLLEGEDSSAPETSEDAAEDAAVAVSETLEIQDAPVEGEEAISVEPAEGTEADVPESPRNE